MTNDVRHDHVMSDMLWEMKKPHFNTALLLKVFTHFMSLMFMSQPTLFKVVFVREEAVDTGGPTESFGG